jgi:hypothetical protein
MGKKKHRSRLRRLQILLKKGKINLIWYGRLILATAIPLWFLRVRTASISK